MGTEPTKIVLLPGQADILTDFRSPIEAAVAGTGGGKTMLGYWWLHSRMEAYPGSTWAMAEPTYQMLDKIILNSSDPGRPTLEEYFRTQGLGVDYSKGEKIIKIYKGRKMLGQIYLYTAENPNSMQGAPVKGFWLDEGGQMRLLAFTTAFQRISMMSGQLLITTTPYDLGWLLTEIVAKSQPGMINVQSWKSIDRPGFPREMYEFAKAHMEPWRFRMLYDAEFERPPGLIYHSFNEPVCVIDRFPIPQNYLIYSGHDFGPDNPAALFTAQDPATGNFFHFHEYLPGAGVSVDEQVKHYKELTKGYTVLKRVGGMGGRGEDDSRNLRTVHGWVINAPKLLHVEPQIEKVIGLHQLNKIYVFRDMVNYLDEKRSFSRKVDDSGNVLKEIKDEPHYHLMACERYMMSEFTPETVQSSNVLPVWQM